MLLPSGPIGDAVAGLMALIAATPFFQTWVGAGSAAAAAANIFALESGYPISSITIASDVMTVHTRDTNTLSVGQKITLAGAAIGAQSALPVAGGYTILSASANTFTVAVAFEDTVQTFEDFCFVYPCVRPIAVVTIPTEGALQAERVGTGGGMLNSGKLEVMIEANTSSQYQNDPQGAPMEANNAAGDLLESMQQTNDTGLATFTDGDGNALEFVANSIHLTVSPTFLAREEQDDGTIRFERWRALFEVAWGSAG